MNLYIIVILEYVWFTSTSSTEVLDLIQKETTNIPTTGSSDDASNYFVIAQMKNEVLDYWKRSDTDSSYRRSMNNTVKRKIRTKSPLRLRADDEPRNVTVMDDSALTPEPEPLETKETTKAQGHEKYMNVYRLNSTVISEIIQGFPRVNVTSERIGRTAEYNDIILFKMTKKNPAYFRADDEKYSDMPVSKRIVFIVHGLSVMGAQHLECFKRVEYFKKLLKYYLRHLDKFDIYLIPVGNPDGLAYVMSYETSRWNKNRSPQGHCSGVAIDRNFDVAWNKRQNTNPCSQQYPGSHPFSEPESTAVREVIHRYGNKIIAYIHVHASSYLSKVRTGDAVLYPSGFIDSTSDDDKYVDVRGEIEESLRNASFEAVEVAVETLHDWYGQVSGTSVDFATAVYGIPYGMEFVMQIYSEDDDYDNQTKEINKNALTEIWQRVIFAVFNTIWRNTNNVETFKKK